MQVLWYKLSCESIPSLSNITSYSVRNALLPPQTQDNIIMDIHSTGHTGQRKHAFHTHVSHSWSLPNIIQPVICAPIFPICPDLPTNTSWDASVRWRHYCTGSQNTCYSPNFVTNLTCELGKVISLCLSFLFCKMWENILPFSQRFKSTKKLKEHLYYKVYINLCQRKRPPIL